MAKDGTNRGGARPGTGPKKKPLSDKILAGTAKKAKVMKTNSDLADLKGVDVPPVSEYMKQKQRDGSDLCAEKVFKDTYLWLKECGCEKLVNQQLIEQYAMSVARWIQCEEAVSQFGYLAKHPTTGNAIASPYVAMSREYKKQVNADWFQIYQIVKENCSGDYGSYNNPQNDVMEMLLRQRGG